jgi:hypothetical protein
MAERVERGVPVFQNFERLEIEAPRVAFEKELAWRGSPSGKLEIIRFSGSENVFLKVRWDCELLPEDNVMQGKGTFIVVFYVISAGVVQAMANPFIDEAWDSIGERLLGVHLTLLEDSRPSLKFGRSKRQCRVWLDGDEQNRLGQWRSPSNLIEFFGPIGEADWVIIQTDPKTQTAQEHYDSEAERGFQ